MSTVEPAKNALRAMPYASWRAALRAWDGVAIYLPVLLMGALALGTYWLVRNAQEGATAPETVKPMRHEVDYFLHRFTVKSFDAAGQLKSEIFGVDARHFADTDILEIDQVRIRSVSDTGDVSTATAQRAYVNGDGSELQLVGQALVVREARQEATGRQVPGMTFSGEFLHVFLNDERVKSHKPVLLTRGQDQFTGDSLDYDHLAQVAKLNGRVKGILMPSSSQAGSAR